MTTIYLYDDARARTFEPFALTRPAGEMRAGALLVRERWERALGCRVVAHITSAHLDGFDEPGAAPVASGSVPADSWIVNARFCPRLDAIPDGPRALMCGDEVVAVRIDGELPLAQSNAKMQLQAMFTSGTTRDINGWLMHEVWDYIGQLQPMLEHDIPILGAEFSTSLPEGAIRIGEGRIFVEPGANVEPSVVFDVSAGPILVRAGAHVQSFTRLVGPLYIGVNSTVTTDRIAASSIGDVCKVHGELSNSIFIGHANKGHDGFVGHSILGRWVNLGAGTITSNLKNTYGSVSLWTRDGVRETGLQFLGTLFGDHAKIGIGVRLTTGCVIGAGANVFGSVMPPKVVAPFAWGEAGAFTEFRFEKFMSIAERVMARRHVTASEGAKEQMQRSHAVRWKVDT